MKKASSYLLLAVAIATTALTSCNSNSNDPNTNTTIPVSGAWKVVYFFDKQDETSNYAGYAFDFGSNGSLSATKNGQTWSGTWSTGIDDSQDKLFITFSGGAPSALLELEEDWLILKMEDNLMQFEHTSGGNGDTDVLHFERI